MADDEEVPTDAPVEEVAAEEAPVAEEEAPMDIETALKNVLKNALIHDGLSRGLHGQVSPWPTPTTAHERAGEVTRTYCAQHGN